MFIEIDGKQLNILNVQSLVTDTSEGYKIIYRFRNGMTKEETFDNEADFNAKMKIIESAGGGSGGGGGGGSTTEGRNEVYEECGFDSYDSSESYVVDDIVYKDGELYKCKGNTTGDWDDSKWEETTLDDYYTETLVTGPLSGSY